MVLLRPVNAPSYVVRVYVCRAVVPDLRMHGMSMSEFAPPHTIGACAADLSMLVKHRGGTCDALVGHSLGGKIALAAVGDALLHPTRVMVLDSMPGPMEPAATRSASLREVAPQLGTSLPFVASPVPHLPVLPVLSCSDKDSVARVLDFLKQLPLPVRDRRAVRDALVTDGFSRHAVELEGRRRGGGGGVCAGVVWRSNHHGPCWGFVEL